MGSPPESSARRTPSPSGSAWVTATPWSVARRVSPDAPRADRALAFNSYRQVTSPSLVAWTTSTVVSGGYVSACVSRVETSAYTSPFGPTATSVTCVVAFDVEKVRFHETDSSATRVSVPFICCRPARALSFSGSSIPPAIVSPSGPSSTARGTMSSNGLCCASTGRGCTDSASVAGPAPAVDALEGPAAVAPAGTTAAKVPTKTSAASQQAVTVFVRGMCPDRWLTPRSRCRLLKRQF